MLKKKIIITLLISIVLLSTPLQITKETDIPIPKPKVVEITKPKPIKKEPIVAKKKETPKPKPVVVEPEPEEIAPEPEEVKEVEESPEVINIILSYYTNSYEDCGKTDAISASGKNLISASRGETYVAAPQDIKFGTQLEIKGLGMVRAEDRGGNINYVYKNGKKYMRIDVFVEGASQDELNEMGIVKTTGYIIK